MRTTMYSSFTGVEMAEKALGALLDHGVSPQDISVVFHETYPGLNRSENIEKISEIRDVAESGITTTTVSDAAVGAAKGAGVGLGVGAVAALASVFIPGLGLVLGGGALATALGGMIGTVAAGAVAGGLTGYLKDQGVPEAAIQEYTSTLDKGGAIISVSVPSNDITDEEVEMVLRKYGALYTERWPAPTQTRETSSSMRS